MTIDPKNIQNISGKDHVKYPGLLDEAHRQGLKRITTTLIQIPSGENGNVAICMAEVETEQGVFSDVGDASPANVGRMIAAHIIRMAATRAKARALRDAVNIGEAAVEEFGGDDHEPARQTAATNTSPNGRRVDQNTGEVLEDNPFDGAGVHDQNQDPSPTLTLAKVELKKAFSAYKAFHHVDDAAAWKAVFGAITVPENSAHWTVQHYTSLTIWLNSNSSAKKEPKPDVTYQAVEV